MKAILQYKKDKLFKLEQNAHPLGQSLRPKGELLRPTQEEAMIPPLKLHLYYWREGGGPPERTKLRTKTS